jgi:DNA-binding NtrC family response regulator
LRLLTRMLTHLGYTVLTATALGEAIQQAEADSGKIHLFLADLDGRDLAQQLLTLYPDMKLLVISSYSHEIADREMVDAATHFIRRPFSMTDLAVKVRQTLDM